MKYKYGISLDDYNNLFVKQNGNCACCGINRSEISKDLYIDHCHSTNKIHGLICPACNSGIGLLGDTYEAVAKALAYLAKSK